MSKVQIHELRYSVVDAFAPEPFSGNPAAVFVIPENIPKIPDYTLAKIAREFNLSETAFVHLPIEGSANYGLRWFTPTTEVSICGHATLASAYILFLSSKEDIIRFDTLSGVLEARRIYIDQNIWETELAFPACLSVPVTSAWDTKIKDVLHRCAGDLVVNSIVCGTEDPYKRYVLVELDKFSSQLPGLKVDISPMLELLPAYAIIILTSATEANSPYAFVSRVFGPAVGVAEDPVTGSAQCVLGPYWETRLGLPTGAQMKTRQESARGGELTISCHGEVCRFRGPAALAAKGEMYVKIED